MATDVNQFLDSYYGTSPQSSAEQAQNEQIEIFSKTAAANGIDLSTLNQDQINYLWDQVFPKQASEVVAPAPAAPEVIKEASQAEVAEEQEKRAQEEYLRKKEAMAKVAEADLLGRIIARSMWDENMKLAAKYDEMAKAAAEGKKEEKEEAKEEKKEEKGESLRDRLMNAAKKPEGKKEEEKKASVSDLDVKAAEEAVRKVASSGHYDVKEAVDRLNAVLTLGPRESVKIASAPNYEAALDIRSLELLEAAGYPIEWAQ